MKVDNKLNEILLAAYSEAKHESHEYMTAEHILYASLFFEEGKRLIKACGGNVENLKEELEVYLRHHIPVKQGVEPMQTVSIQHALTAATNQVISSDRESIKFGDIIIAIYDLEESYAAYFMKLQGIKRIDILNYIAHGVGAEDFEEEDSEEFLEEDEYELNIEFEDEDEYLDEDEFIDEKSGKQSKLLQNFTIDLTERAEAGKLDPLIGRIDIINRTMQILCRRNKNNPVHVGEPGVGKTAITEGLAKLIVDGNVPEPLQGARIFSLDMGSMLAGTKYRGDFEERFKKVLKEIAKIPKAIVYIDEIHTVIGAGAVSGGAMDASNLLKPFLVDGSLKFIGSTTYDEYKKFFEKDKALTRRFQKIDINEPTISETIEILKGLKERFQDYHEVVYTENALKAAAELSSKYINDRFLPDKAIDIIDEAGAKVRMSKFIDSNSGNIINHDGDNRGMNKNAQEDVTNLSMEHTKDTQENQEVVTITSEDIEKVVASIARIPEQNVSSSDIEKLKNLEGNIKEKIYGQEKAVESIVRAIKRSRAGFNDDDKPVANLLFVGPTGVGKTEVCKQLAHYMSVPLVRFDMSEYQEKHSVARLIGAPPGYVGYEEGGMLVDSIRKNPHCVLLLDEIEKVHPDILNVLLQIMDYATLTDNNGKKADFRNVIIIMTSNAGARNVGKSLLGFGNRTVHGEAIKEEVEKVFSPEFRNRLDDIIVFNGIDESMAMLIAKKAIKDFEEKLQRKNISLEVTDECYKWIVEKGFSKEFGAREINRVVQTKIKPYFVDAVLFGDLTEGGVAIVDIMDGEVKITKKEL